MKSLRIILVIAIIATITNNSYAYKWLGEVKKHEVPSTRATANCDPPKNFTELAVNNVKTRINTGGDMWWDMIGMPLYEVPAGGGAHALYAGSIWVGGLDANGQLKLAAQKFRQAGIDFWPGPLITDGPDRGSVSDQICRDYDKHFVIDKVTVTEFKNYMKCKNDPDCDEIEEYPDYRIPESIENWPGNGPDGGYSQILAPYFDANRDGVYSASDGDFPWYTFDEIHYNGFNMDPDANCERDRNKDYVLFGDHTLWWVYNDRGNVHTETGGAAIGMEFKSQAFAFATNDELNNMTFYNYKISNWSTYTLYDTYFGVWTDADLGNPLDDYVGCDVVRGLGYCYNGKEEDASEKGHVGYGKQPPAVGIDFFEGPYQDPTGVDKPSSFVYENGVKTLVCDENYNNGNINGLNFGDGKADNERWGMRRFLYFNNSSQGANAATRDPQNALEHYNYLTGKWRDNSILAYGGNGHFEGGANLDIPADFMFPGSPTTDICNWGTRGIPAPHDWSEEYPGPGLPKNPVDDRRFVQSAGPFTLKPGAVNDITLGAVYARATSGGAWASVEALQRADDKAQLLFENCFRVLNGPDAPDLTIIELDKKLIFHISNKPSSNNYLNQYVEKDPSIVCNGSITPCDTAYRFQGYQIFQFKNNSVNINDRTNRDLVKEVYQCDVKDGVSKLVNYTWSDELGANVPSLEVQGSDNGISFSFVVENDLFSEGELINNKEYYYSAIAYGYNASKPYNQAIENAYDGQKTPYIAGRNNIKVYPVVPRKNHADGTVQQSVYGTGLAVTMHEGYGNSNNVIDLADESIEEIMKGYPWHIHNNRKYKEGRGPIEVKVINPLNIPEDSYWLKFNNDTRFNDAGIIGTRFESVFTANGFTPFTYTITNSEGEEVNSDVSITYGVKTEQIFSDWGFSVTVNVDNFAGIAQNSYQNGFLDASIEFADPTRKWLTFVNDDDGPNFYNWIRAGSNKNKAGESGDGENAVDYTYDDMSLSSSTTNAYLADPEGFFGKILSGTWAPYMLTNPYKYGLAPFTNKPDGSGIAASCILNVSSDRKINPYFSELLSSVDIYITNDTSKWTRSVVVEMCENEWNLDRFGREVETNPRLNYKSEGGALKFSLRKSPSVDKKGEPLNDGTHGYGWFPGYAIDIRTGERLNIAFGENSWLTSENGNDMIWNPTSRDAYKTEPLFGGQHVIYVFGNNYSKEKNSATSLDQPAYDSCRVLHDALLQYELYGLSNDLYKAWRAAMWCAIPLVDTVVVKQALPAGTNIKDPRNFILNDVKIRLRVATPYTVGVNDLEVEEPVNNNFPLFSFTTKDVKTLYNIKDVAVRALDSINVVPNPYYGYSEYETEQLDNYIRIINLPRRCDITIYNSAGTLVRTFRKDNVDTYLEWDMKNSYNISIASGVYIIHVKGYDSSDGSVTGEKILKWFGALRPVDLNNF